MTDQEREVKTQTFMHRIGEAFGQGAAYFIRLWPDAQDPQGTAQCITEAVRRLQLKYQFMDSLRQTLRSFQQQEPDLFRQVLGEFLQQ